MNRVFKLIGILLASLLGAFSHQLHAQVLLTAPATSTTGAYTVQSNTAAGCWTGTNGIDYCGWLVEYQNNVQIDTFYSGDSWSFSRCRGRRCQHQCGCQHSSSRWRPNLYELSRCAQQYDGPCGGNLLLSGHRG